METREKVLRTVAVVVLVVGAFLAYDLYFNDARLMAGLLRELVVLVRASVY